jgi:hypothetical protein
MHIKIGDVEGFMSVSWVLGWLFTIGYAKLGFSQGIVALVIWPYYIGAALAH